MIKMTIIRIALYSVFLCVIPHVSLAYRPLTTEDAEVAGKGVAQLELSWDHAKSKHDTAQVFLAVPVYGVTDTVELSLEIPYLVKKPGNEPASSAYGDINVVAKYLLVPEKATNPALAVKGVVKLDNGNYRNGSGTGDKDYSLFAVMSKNFNGLALYAHMGYTRVGNKNGANLRNIYLYALAADYGVTERFHIVGEVSGTKNPDRNVPAHLQTVLTGVTYKLSEKITFDAAVKRGLTSSTPDWGLTFGISLTL